MPEALALAASLNCRQLNALVGLEVPTLSRLEQLTLAAKNVRWAADLAAAQDARILIEPLNRHDVRRYLLPQLDSATEFIRSVDRPNVLLQFDVYHTQRAEGNLVANLLRHMAYISHVQIADSPGRHEPGTGEINYRYVTSQLEKLGYESYLGLEFEPQTTTADSLRWVPRDQRSGEISVERLDL